MVKHDSWNKIVALSYLLITVDQITRVFSHASDETSDDIEIEGVQRRSIYSEAKQWQYEGLPIEFPGMMGERVPLISRKSAGNAKTTVTKKATVKTTKVPATTKSAATTTSTARIPTDPTTSSTLTTPVYPPLDRRYRRIYNPDEVATVAQHPYVAALLVNKQLWCGAVIIDSDRLLTAAHCLQLQYNNRFFREYVKMLTVRVGSTNATAGGEVMRVTEIFFHPNYKPTTLEFNYAVLKLHKNMTFGRSESKINRIEYSRDKIVPVDNTITFLGWGSVLGMNGVGGQVLLQKVALPVYDLADCQEVYGRDLVTRNNFCAGFITKAKNVCNHDAGGPAVLNGMLVGILSFSSKRCDQPDQPAVFSTVGTIVPWLENLGERKVQLRKTAIKSSEPIYGV